MIKDTIKNLSLSATLKINEKSKVIENEGKNIIRFGFGQSPFPVPITIVEELKKNAHQNFIRCGIIEILAEQLLSYGYAEKQFHRYPAREVGRIKKNLNKMF